MSFPFDATAALAKLLRNVGEAVTELPSIVPVAVISDYSLRSSTESIECRGLAAWVKAGVGGQSVKFQIHAPTRPVVVELLRVKQTNPAAVLTMFLGFFTFQDPVGAVGVMDLGGIAHTALVDSLTSAGVVAGVLSFPLESGVPEEIPGSMPLRLLIPVGQTLTCGIVPVVGDPLEVALLFREIVA